MSDRLDALKELYSKYFRSVSAGTLVQCETELSRLIDDDSFCECILLDDVIVLYELVRDECVCRVAKIADMEPLM